MREVLCYRLVSPDKVGIASLEQVRSDEGLHWIHLSGWPRSEAKRFLMEDLGVAESLAEAASSSLPSQRPSHRMGELAFTLTLPMESQDDPAPRVLGVAALGSRIVTLACQPCSLVPDLMQTWVEDPEGVGDHPRRLLYSLIDEVADTYIPLIDQIHDRVEALEEEVFEERTISAATAICIKREILNVRREAGGIRDTIQGIIRHGEPWAPRDMTAEYQDTLSHILRSVESMDIARDIISSLMEAQTAITGNRLNQNMRVLTVISTALMAPTLVAGIYGMNVRMRPGAEEWWGFPFTIALMAISALVTLWLFRRQKWI